MGLGEAAKALQVVEEAGQERGEERVPGKSALADLVHAPPRGIFGKRMMGEDGRREIRKRSKGQREQKTGGKANIQCTQSQPTRQSSMPPT
jgi:hypothetical protein